MRVIVAGRGQFAQDILHHLPSVSKEMNLSLTGHSFDDILPESCQKEDDILIHVGSGRQLPQLIQFAQEKSLLLIHASTTKEGLKLPEKLHFPFIEAPNLAIPIIKLMKFLEEYGHFFGDYKISIEESHQKEKVHAPGTALAMAKFLQASPECITSIRDPLVQKEEWNIPEEFLAGHALHRISVRGQGCEINFGTKVLGRKAYVYGIATLASKRSFIENGHYFINDLIEKKII